MDFLKDHDKFYDKTNKHFKGKVRKEGLWELFTSRCKLPVKVCKTWLESKKRLTTAKTHPVQVWPGSQGMTERQNWI